MVDFRIDWVQIKETLLHKLKVLKALKIKSTY